MRRVAAYERSTTPVQRARANSAKAKDGHRIDACSFIRGIAAHHFSYAWARRSPVGKLAELYWTRLSTAGNRTDRFWRFVVASPPGKSAPGAKLFTKHQLSVLANLPGEIS